MTSRERVKTVLNFKPVDRLPRHLWSLSGVQMFRREELLEILRDFPVDFDCLDYTYGKENR